MPTSEIPTLQEIVTALGGERPATTEVPLLNQILTQIIANGSASSAVAWGDITGTLSNQTDLNTALGLRTLNSSAAITGGTITGLTDFGVALANNTAITGINLGTITDTTPRPCEIYQTWNNGALESTGVLKVKAIETAASTLGKVFSVYGGATGTTHLFSVRPTYGDLSIGNTGLQSIYAGDANTLGFMGGSFFVRGNAIAPSFTVPGAYIYGGFLFKDYGGAEAPLMIRAAGALGMGVPLASGWVNQSFGAAGAIVGTTTNGSPTNTFTVHGSVSTGTGTGGNVVLGVYGSNGASGTAIGTFLSIATVSSAGLSLRNTAVGQQLLVYGTADAYGTDTNYVRARLSCLATSMALQVQSAGTGATDVDLTLIPAGAGFVQFGAHSGLTAETLSGYITIKDAGGTTRKVGIIS